MYNQTFLSFRFYLAEYLFVNQVSEIQEEKFTIIKSTIRMIFSVKVLLRFAMMFHYGVMRGFIFVELPTAYTSCIFGIQSVNLFINIS